MEFSESVYERFNKYLSSYLIQGWKQDKFYIKSVEVESKKMVVLVDIHESYLPYLSSLPAIPLLYQFGIFFSCWESGFSEKTGDIYLRSLDIETPRMIQKTEDIKFELNLVKKRKLKEWFFYIVDFNIDDNAFTGKMQYAVPLPKIVD
ncbi:hypothetical protein OGM63_20605 [Plectonema radiosum NIES-515]|uniref:Uncharacterized protein n=1 Tax=Plectonema radiosum NIES-515 TaxID=2986073 RepID=A0ABT3B3D2_9CYAN|nr:hypothetical protein [Plectonema radiosum]MCV3215879.1 hypothetical protein [Plectonema radiosum NIES-515]